MRTFLIYLILIVVSSGCDRETLSDLRKNTPVLTAVLEAGNSTAEARLFSISDDSNTLPTAISTAQVTIENPEGQSTALQFNGELYRSAQGEIELNPETTYTIKANTGEEELIAYCKIPPTITLINASNTTFTVNTNSLGSPAFLLTWNTLDSEKYSYLLTLENLESNPLEIPFSVPSGNFSNQFSGPWELSGATIYDTDFRYYGHHRLKIMAIDKSVESIYFYGPADLRGLLQNGPDNIIGGRGYVFGITSFTVDLWIQ